MAPSGASAAQFVEVRVHEELGILRVSRVLSVVDGTIVATDYYEDALTRR